MVAWGNALGGWRKQPRSKGGKFGHKAGGAKSTYKKGGKGNSARRRYAAQQQRAAAKKAQRRKVAKRVAVGALAVGAVAAGGTYAVRKGVKKGFSNSTMLGLGNERKMYGKIPDASQFGPGLERIGQGVKFGQRRSAGKVDLTPVGSVGFRPMEGPSKPLAGPGSKGDRDYVTFGDVQRSGSFIQSLSERASAQAGTQATGSRNLEAIRISAPGKLSSADYAGKGFGTHVRNVKPTIDPKTAKEQIATDRKIRLANRVKANPNASEGAKYVANQYLKKVTASGYKYEGASPGGLQEQLNKVRGEVVGGKSVTLSGRQLTTAESKAKAPGKYQNRTTSNKLSETDVKVAGMIGWDPLRPGQANAKEKNALDWRVNPETGRRNKFTEDEIAFTGVIKPISQMSRADRAALRSRTQRDTSLGQQLIQQTLGVDALGRASYVANASPEARAAETNRRAKKERSAAQQAKASKQYVGDRPRKRRK